MRQKLSLFLAAVALVFCLSGCTGGNAANENDATQGNEDTQIIRVAFNQQDQHPQCLAMEEFGEAFYAATDGAYKVEVYPNAILGNQTSVAEFVRTGAIQMAIVPCSIPESYDSDFAIVGAPYLYDDMDHLERVVLSGTFDELFKSTRKFNFEVVAAYNSGVRNIYAAKPINTPEDLKGQKIRVMDSESYIEMVNLMGGVGIPMSQGEVYTAIQQKVIEGAENSERVYTDFKHYEVAPYYSYTQHIVLPDVVLANTEFLDNMSDEHRKLFDKLMRESVEKEFGLFKESVQEGKADAEAMGATFVYPDIEPFRERCQPLLDKIAGKSEITKEIYDKAEALREVK